MSDISPARTKCGYIALIGAPNAGKSTLLNQMLGHKLAIVSPKAQTTRSRLIGISVVDDAQILYVDTPGIFEPRRRLDRAMVKAAWTGADDADIILILIDAVRGMTAQAQAILDRLEKADRQAIVVLNKIDQVAKPRLLTLAGACRRSPVTSEIFMISALNGDGVGDLRNRLAALVPEGPWLFPADQLTDISERLLAAEITREQLYLKLHNELPYATTVETETWQQQRDGSLRIQQVIFVQRASQKAIVLGKQGQMVKAIGEAARAELTKLFETKVHLFLFVKVRDKWIDDPERYREMGLDYVP